MIVLQSKLTTHVVWPNHLSFIPGAHTRYPGTPAPKSGRLRKEKENHQLKRAGNPGRFRVKCHPGLQKAQVVPCLKGFGTNKFKCGFNLASAKLMHFPNKNSHFRSASKHSTRLPTAFRSKKHCASIHQLL